MYNSNTDSLGLILDVEVIFSLGHCSGALCITIIYIDLRIMCIYQNVDVEIEELLIHFTSCHVQDITREYLVSLPEVKCEYEDDPKCPDHHDHCGVSLRVPVCILVSHFSNDNSHWKAELL